MIVSVLRVRIILGFSVLNLVLLEAKSSRREDSEEVIIEGKKHQEDDEDQADLLSNFHLLDADGPSQNSLQY